MASTFGSPNAALRDHTIACLLVGASAGLFGCGKGAAPTPPPVVTIAIAGHVMGGQHGIQSAQVVVYAAGSSGNASAAIALGDPVFTAADGSFSVTSSDPCTSGTGPLYIVASGGTAGAASSSSNPALVLMTALGPCDRFASASGLVINEVTTVAAAWALARFMNSATSVGSTATNTHGITNAFLNAQLLASSTSGEAPTLAANVSIEAGKLYALANALNPCVVTGGTTCAALFAAATPLTGVAPQNTLGAALNIVQHPGENVATVFKSIAASPPFSTTLTQAPNDWTMSLTVTGGGLNAPASIAMDASGNAWVANYVGVLSAFSPQGTPLSSAGYGVGTLSESYGLAIDPSNNVWVTNEETPSHAPTTGSVSAFLGANSATPGSLLNGSSYFYDVSIDFPRAVAADTNGNILIADYGNSSATIYSSAGKLLQSGVPAGAAALPVAISADGSHGFWLANQGDNSVAHISSTGALLAHTVCCDGASGIAIDPGGNAWVANYNNSSVSEVSSTGMILIDGDTGGGIGGNNPNGVAIDAGGTVWFANFRGNNFSALADNGGVVAVGTPLSPDTGYGLDAHLVLPFGIAPDASGDIWISNFGGSSIVMFFGLGTPTATPVMGAPSAP